MPTGKRAGNGKYAIPAEDLAEFMDMLGGELARQTLFPMKHANIGKLVEDLTNKGYTVRVVPIGYGGGRLVQFWVGERKVERSANTPEKWEEEVRMLIMAVEKLPHKRD